MSYSTALTTDIQDRLVAHLSRPDGQEDLCFGLYRISHGATRRTILLYDLVLPQPGERRVHGNVSFTGEYFLRAAAIAAAADAGLVFLHSHPHAKGWQGMSADDVAAERGHAIQTLEVTEKPLVGMTLATAQMSWSARSWEAAGRAGTIRIDHESVRVVGDKLDQTFNPALRPIPPATERQTRTISAWGNAIQADITRTKIAVVGAGSVGAIVAEVLSRVGVQQIVLIDFDSVKLINLDRLLHASARDVRLGRSKVETLRHALLDSATAHNPSIDALEHSVVEPAGLKAALDCDLIFSCVDRPWARSALNFLAYAHLIPVVDGGIRVTVEDHGLQGADWKAHVAAPGRCCLECLGQYDPGHVAVERDGHLDDPSYIRGLPAGHALKTDENVFAFSLHTAGMEVLQALSMIIAPHELADVGAQNYHFVTGSMDTTYPACQPRCPYGHELLASAHTSGIEVTGRHHAAEAERAERSNRQRRARVSRFTDRILQRIQRKL